jgi:hypothetical protein
MPDLTHPASTPTGPGPRGRGPIRFSLNHVPERERPGLYREFLGRSVFRMDVEPLRNVPFEVDVTVRKLPGLQLFSGRLHGSRNGRTRELLADGNDDFALMVNLGGPYLVSQRRRELVLGDGEATVVSSAEICSLTHHPPGDVLALLFPRKPFAPLVAGLEDCYLRRIPQGNQALRLLTDYVDIAGGRPVGGGACGPPPVHAALHPAAVRDGGHHVHRVRAGATSRANAPHADRPAPHR